MPHTSFRRGHAFEANPARGASAAPPTSDLIPSLSNLLTLHWHTLEGYRDQAWEKLLYLVIPLHSRILWSKMVECKCGEQVQRVKKVDLHGKNEF